MVGGSKRKITQTAVINIFLLGTVVGFTAGFELQLLSRQDVSDEGFYILKCCERPDFKKKNTFLAYPLHSMCGKGNLRLSTCDGEAYFEYFCLN